MSGGPEAPISMNATVRDVAKKARVSAMTVSRVINGHASVRPETRRRVQQAIAELDFVPNSLARGLMSSRTGTLALIVPDIVNPFFAMVVRGAETVARRAGYRMLLCNSEGDLGLERQYVEDMIAHRVEGLLIAPVNDRSKANLMPIVRRQFPFVLIDRSIAGLSCDLVQADSVVGASKLTNHLISIGHRRIAVIIEPDDVSTARERMRGYAGAMKAAGLKVPPELVIRTSADRAGGYGAMQQILGMRPRPTAVFAVNNMTALGAMQAIRDRGLVVPRDIALVCFDDVEHLAVLSPFLTVVNQPTEMLGTLAAELLLTRISSDDGGERRQVVLQAELLVRESCGAKVSLPPTDPPEDTNNKPRKP
ncbi:MAG TPA: LacI family DNA-binding transcriptional regulator [Polyangia bacterium]|nr:LacI family DNA-binding transcriptional regulator [Polyangia bacterium]